MKNHHSSHKSSAFTLADVLVTIGIIGMVAMLLMPGVLEGYTQLVTVAQLKKAYAMSAGAYELAVVSNGTPDNWNLGQQGDPNGLVNLNNVMSQNLKVTRNCGTDPGCFPDIKYKDLHGTENPAILNQDASYTKMVLANGTLISLKSWDPNCTLNWGTSAALNNVCGLMGVDINGFEAPNKYGADYFGFVITKKGIVPMGGELQQSYPFSDYCNKDSDKTDVAANGLSCTAWAIYKDNMDYLNNSNLVWANEAVRTNGNNGNNNTNGNANSNNGGNNNMNGNTNQMGANFNPNGNKNELNNCAHSAGTADTPVTMTPGTGNGNGNTGNGNTKKN